MKIHEYDLEPNQGVTCESQKGRVSVVVLEIDEKNQEVLLGVDVPNDVKVLAGGPPREAWGAPHCNGLPRIWLCFAFLIAGKTKKEIFLPAFNEFVEDYLFAKKMHPRKWERRWMQFAFTLRSIGIVCTCFKIQISTLTILVAKSIWEWLFRES